LLTGLLLLTAPGRSALAQVIPEYPHLGLSAAPDRYVDTLDIQQGEPFTLYMIMIGPQQGPLPFDLAQTQWTVHAACCGASYNVVDIAYNETMHHEGELPGDIHSTVEVCAHQDVVLLAAITFELLFQPVGTYLLPAGATGLTLDCDGGSHLMMDLSVILNIGATGTPTDVQSWGAVKAIYR
jgi:hypothetical protein